MFPFGADRSSNSGENIHSAYGGSVAEFVTLRFAGWVKQSQSSSLCALYNAISIP